MCGIVGTFGATDARVFGAFELMLSLIATRGWDSTGVAFLHPDQKPKVLKGTMLPLEMLRTDSFQKHGAEAIKAGFGFIGHVRAATQGKVNAQNAHPFQYGHITMVHNGTLVRDIVIQGKPTETDSESICAGIAQKGIEAVWRELDGAASLVWWDSKTQKLNLISNGKRPLVFGYIDGRRTMFYGSEAPYVRKPALKAGLKFRKDTVWKVADDVLYSFSIGPNGKIKEEERKLDTRPLAGFSRSGSFGAADADWWEERMQRAGSAPTQSGVVRIMGGQGHNVASTANVSNTSSTAGERVSTTAAGGSCSTGCNGTTHEHGYPSCEGECGDELDPNDPVDDIAFDHRQPEICTREHFDKTFKQCCLCRKPLAGEFLTARIISAHEAACEECVGVAKANNISLDSLRGA